MMTAQQCVVQAKQFERRARDAGALDRKALIQGARQWRLLARTAQPLAAHGPAGEGRPVVAECVGRSP